ncbi:pectinesterase inhibitor 6 [Andrographis paniculata]|uniref:pectinesterase inhibitor 6 n=1 Tax=Andrographis paniculata TaxID=175694 RepID=UPI0021E82EAC|nr:pectinesterase inhibitor 6 [Andrographis paniculata]
MLITSKLFTYFLEPMAQGYYYYVLMFILSPCLFMLACSGSPVEDACSVTRYQDLCIRSLASFSGVAKHSPGRWARAGVSVTIAESKRVGRYLAGLKKSRKGGLNKVALSDCIDCFEDSLDNLHRSLYVLRKLSVREFVSEIEDVTTWISAALTDSDTCADGFAEGKRVGFIINRVSNVTFLTSNALALVNRLGTAGPDCLTNGNC